MTPEEVAAQKDRLPRGWGRFGKGIDALPALAAPDEPLLAACVTLNPTFQHRAVGLAGGLMEATGDMNVVVAVTDRRLLLVRTAINGNPRGNEEIAFEGLEIAAREKKEFTLGWPAGTARFKGAAKTMIGPFLDTLEAQLAARG
ncbi:MAG: hypothetical protein U0W40_00205 [Acidimicrobiia bacterium]